MKSTTVFDAPAVRADLLKRGGPVAAGFVRHTYRPFDTRWLYWEGESGLLDRPRPEYMPHVLEGNVWLSSAQHLRKGATEPQTCFTQHIGSLHLIERGANMFPAWLREEGLEFDNDGTLRRHNLSADAQRYLARLGAGVEDLFYHVLAVLHDPAYRDANAGALCMEWPRIPIPGWPDGTEAGVAKQLLASAARGRELASLLNSDAQVSGVTIGVLRPEIAAVAVPSTTDGGNMIGDDFALTAGWGHFGQGKAVMPGQGHVVERPYTANESAALGEATQTLGETTFDLYLNDRAYWRNLPVAVWSYKLGGYQVLKKWLSYREHAVLGRPMTPAEVQHFTDTARRIAAILLLTEMV